MLSWVRKAAGASIDASGVPGLVGASFCRPMKAPRKLRYPIKQMLSIDDVEAGDVNGIALFLLQSSKLSQI
jgi:hypothetical protein